MRATYDRSHPFRNLLIVLCVQTMMGATDPHLHGAEEEDTACLRCMAGATTAGGATTARLTVGAEDMTMRGGMEGLLRLWRVVATLWEGEAEGRHLMGQEVPRHHLTGAVTGAGGGTAEEMVGSHPPT